MLRLILVSCLIASFINSKANNYRYPFIGLRSQYGFIIAHSRELERVSHSNPWGVEVDLGWHLTSEKTWQYCFCYPRTGVMLSYYNFSNPSVLGNGYGVTPYVEPFLTAHKAFSISIRVGLGLIYLDNIYHPISNPDNNFYSTHISALLHGSISLNYRITNQINIKTSAYYNHISNGSIKQPNKGINFPMLSIGADYTFGSSIAFPSRNKADYNLERSSKSYYRFSPYFTLKEVSKDDKKQYPIIGASAKYSYLVGRLSAVSAGVDFTWDGSVREIILRNNIENSSPNRIALTLGHELLIGKINFYQELGIYLYSPFEADDPVYQRYGFEYFIYKNISVGVNLKAHRHVADFMDFRISFSI